MDLQTILAIVFIAMILLFLLKNRKRIEVQSLLFPLFYFLLCRTKLGLEAMDKWAKKFSTFFVWLSTAGIVVGFAAMFFVMFELFKSAYTIFTQPAAAPGIMLVLPIETKGVFFVPLFYWIFSIFIIAVVHEFSHGLIARAYNLPVKASGIAVLGIIIPIIPAAFVEPDEKKMAKAPMRTQLAVFAAGSFANILLALILIFLFGIQMPLLGNVTKSTAIIDLESTAAEWSSLEGLKIINVTEGSPAEFAMVRNGLVVTGLNDVPVSNTMQFAKEIGNLTVGEKVTLETDYKTYEVEVSENPKKPGTGYLGLTFESITKHNKIGVEIVLTLISLVFWIILLNLGVGMFNLLPLGPLDGGRMAKIVFDKISKKHGPKLFKILSAVLLAIVLLNIVVGFIN